VLRNGSKSSHTTCMLRFFTVSCLALNTNLIFEIGSKGDGMVKRKRAAENEYISAALQVFGLMERGRCESRTLPFG
jgi:hypothetical protein